MVAAGCSIATLVLQAVDGPSSPNQETSPFSFHDRSFSDFQLAAPFVAGTAVAGVSGGRSPNASRGNITAALGGKSPAAATPPLKLTMNYSLTTPKTKAAKEFMLCPSAAPTPRKQSFPGNFQVRPAQIWAPSAGTANDFARVRNGGKSMQTRLRLGSPPQARMSSPPQAEGLLRVSSAPVNLNSPIERPMSSSPKTPRATRGMVRKVSKVFCSYPEVNLLAQLKPPSPSSTASLTDTVRTISSARPNSEPPSKPKRMTQKRVSFADEVPEALRDITTSVSPSPDRQTRELKKSLRLMDSLHDMRRVQKDEESLVAAGVPIPREEEDDSEQGALLHSTLSELYDNEASCRALERQLQDAHVQVCDNGGARHATTLLSARTLGVVRRKAQLLHAVEARANIFEATHAKHDELVPQIMTGELEIPLELTGIIKFINKYTHKGGDPVDADRSDFEGFVASFKLPARHRQLVRLRELSQEISQWWAEASLRVAQEGANYVQIRRMFAVATGAGADDEHPYLLRATTILIDRLADKVLKDAQDAQRRDTAMAERTEVPQVGPASRAADVIEQSIIHVISEGVPLSDRRIAGAKQIMKELREADGQRKRLAARQKRLEGKGGR